MHMHSEEQLVLVKFRLGSRVTNVYLVQFSYIALQAVYGKSYIGRTDCAGMYVSCPPVEI